MTDGGGVTLEGFLYLHKLLVHPAPLSSIPIFRIKSRGTHRCKAAAKRAFGRLFNPTATPPPPPSSSCPPPSRPFPNCRGCRFCPPPPPLARQGGERNRCNSIIIVITSTTTTTTTATNPPFAPDCLAGQWRPSRFSHSPSAQLHSRIGVSCK